MASAAASDRHTDAAPSGYAKSRDTRARILAATLEEAGESGFYKASTAAIAARAGVAIGSVNYHFGSRDELLRELMNQLMADYSSFVEAAEAQSAGDYFARKRAALLAYVAYVRLHPRHARLAAEIRLLEPELYLQGEEHWVDRVAARMRNGIAEGTLRPMDDDEIQLKAHLLVGARHSLERLALRDATLSNEALVDAFLDLERQGLGARALATLAKETQP